MAEHEAFLEGHRLLYWPFDPVAICNTLVLLCKPEV